MRPVSSEKVTTVNGCNLNGDLLCPSKAPPPERGATMSLSQAKIGYGVYTPFSQNCKKKNQDESIFLRLPS
jgi:hypothetical protein